MSKATASLAKIGIGTSHPLTRRPCHVSCYRQQLTPPSRPHRSTTAPAARTTLRRPPPPAPHRSHPAATGTYFPSPPLLSCSDPVDLPLPSTRPRPLLSRRCRPRLGLACPSRPSALLGRYRRLLSGSATLAPRTPGPTDPRHRPRGTGPSRVRLVLAGTAGQSRRWHGSEHARHQGQSPALPPIPPGAARLWLPLDASGRVVFAGRRHGPGRRLRPASRPRQRRVVPVAHAPAGAAAGRCAVGGSRFLLLLDLGASAGAGGRCGLASE